ncbi:MAG: L-threonylcarbamoyladenylate synthase [Deltaproteobacteria bacterium]|jgi:L-threonylcarbamoyladenylate synthase|nr:L-threonylcarbamoyladenylate synthase [Deltaproteobacteria bacterium]MBW2543491.1 L-threonylcarbamoyladenylate synthase [Deltaproteobacteria bacterium]
MSDAVTLDDPIGAAVDWVRGGGLLAYPTETVWGLGADACSVAAVDRLRGWKGQRESAPISILIADPDALEPLGFEFNELAQRLAGAFWPGPLTLVMNCRGRFAPGVPRHDGAVGVRCSSHPLSVALARRLADEGVGPITSTSLNRSGATPAATREQVQEVCGSGPDSPRLLAVEGAEAGGEGESTVIDTTGPELVVLRWGALAKPNLAAVLESLEEDE